MRRTSPTSSTDPRAGFTLVELTAVMLIVALMASVVAAFTAGTGRPALKAVTMKAAALLRQERLGAILTGQVREVALDGPGRALIGGGGDAVAIPRDVVVDVLGAEASSSKRVSVVRFHPDGASSGAVIKLSRERAAYEIRVNWYTGGVAILPP